MTGQTHESQVLENHNEDWQVGDEPDEDEKDEGLGQTRGQGITEQGRYRITLRLVRRFTTSFRVLRLCPKVASVRAS